MDVSDGLAGDLAKLVGGAGLTAIVDLDAVPLSPAARAALVLEPALFETIVTGGDDYEILCAAPPDAVPALTAAGEAVGLTAIGVAVDGPGPPRFRRSGREIGFARASFSHI